MRFFSQPSVTKAKPTIFKDTFKEINTDKKSLFIDKLRNAKKHNVYNVYEEILTYDKDTLNNASKALGLNH